jgi:pimeloyl-ACP methyl ester carboxylesterase
MFWVHNKNYSKKSYHTLILNKKTMAKQTKINIEDIRGIAKIITDATINVTDLVEEVHIQVIHPPLLKSTPVQRLITDVSGFVYDLVRFCTKLIGGGLEKSLGTLNPKLNIGISMGEKETVLAILNGVVGDYLQENKNPLAISMALRQDGEAIDFDKNKIAESDKKVSGKILLMIHGLCMNDIQWTWKGHNHGEILAKLYDFTPVYLHYNTGLHISENGQKMNLILEELIENWSVPVEEIVILGHSMGGLLTRSAFYYGEQNKQTWMKYLTKIIFLGTPHHGSPLERIGNYVDRLLTALPYAKPFARLGKMRSSGVTDLRFGSLVDEDWQGRERFEKQTDERKVLPLPKNVDCYTIAATIGKLGDNLKERTVGDGLVQLKGALGKHDDKTKDLGFKAENSMVLYKANHMDLLSDKRVLEQVEKWILSSTNRIGF